jgi:hypothetical protein
MLKPGFLPDRESMRQFGEKLLNAKAVICRKCPTNANGPDKSSSSGLQGTPSPRFAFPMHRILPF